VSTTFTPAYGGSASLPCTTTVTASAPDIVSDAIAITVSPQATISTCGAQIVGGGLMTSCTAYLSTAQHGGAQVTVASTNPSVIGVSASPTGAAAASFIATVPNGQNWITYYLQGLASSGAAAIDISEPRFAPAAHGAQAVQAGVEVWNLPATTSVETGESNQVYVVVGPTTGAGTISYGQVVRPGAPVVVTLTSSNEAVGRLRSDEPPASAQTVTKPIVPGQYYSLAAGGTTAWGLAFVPLGAGTTTVTATAPGFVTMPAGVRQVEVTGPTLTPSGPVAVGSGLMTSTYVVLSAAAHGGRQVTVTSTEPSRVLVSVDTLTEGVASFTTTIPNGQSIFNYIVHGIGGTTGPGTITVAVAGFGEVSHQATVVPAGVELHNLDPTTSPTAGEDRDLYVLVGVPNFDNSGVSIYQPVRAGHPLVITIENSNPLVGELRSDEPPATGQVVTKPILPGGYYSVPRSGDTSTSWGLAFRPLAEGTSAVTVSGPPGVLTMSATGVRQVQVGEATITPPGALVVGGGLMFSTAAYLGASGHGGRQVTVTSTDPSRVTVSLDAATEGTASVSFTVPNGQVWIPYHVHGMAAGGDATVTIQADGFTTASHTVTVVEAGVEIFNLGPVVHTLSVDRDWYAGVGVPLSDGSRGHRHQQHGHGGASPVRRARPGRTGGDEADPARVVLHGAGSGRPVHVVGIRLRPADHRHDDGHGLRGGDADDDHDRRAAGGGGDAGLPGAGHRNRRRGAAGAALCLARGERARRRRRPGGEQRARGRPRVPGRRDCRRGLDDDPRPRRSIVDDVLRAGVGERHRDGGGALVGARLPRSDDCDHGGADGRRDPRSADAADGGRTGADRVVRAGRDRRSVGHLHRRVAGGQGRLAGLHADVHG
jgi:hypothetical protein